MEYVFTLALTVCSPPREDMTLHDFWLAKGRHKSNGW
jgi:hypothetical protein